MPCTIRISVSIIHIINFPILNLGNQHDMPCRRRVYLAIRIKRNHYVTQCFPLVCIKKICQTVFPAI